ncbi:MAG: ribosome small subunit-dependent GTPase A [Bacteroidetes bacterium SW_11_45_7]|nr:MAG: ribosome small subunit-dependent GTPase A [Bacteroidetes bacterium SW_11_45_7]
MKGKVLKSTGSWYTVETDDGLLLDCRLKGKFRLSDLDTTNPVSVGDDVIVSDEEDVDANVITEVLPRQNYIIRQSPKQSAQRHIIASNIEQALLIVTVAKPRTSTGFIDRFLVTAEAYAIPTHIVFNKQDALTEKELKKQQAIAKVYEDIGYPVYYTSVPQEENVKTIHELLKGKTTLLSGHSGVGKSTIVNSIYPDLNLRTKEISKKVKKGMHTTTFVEMHALPDDAYIIDTPGIKEFGLTDMEAAEVSGYFPEMRERLDNCQFNDCLHMNEPGCAVKEAVQNGEISEERYHNYLSIVENLLEDEKY